MRIALRGRGTRHDDLRADRHDDLRADRHDDLGADPGRWQQPVHRTLRSEPRPFG